MDPDGRHGADPSWSTLCRWGRLAVAVGGHYLISSTEVFGFGTGILAYTLGMRHAFDADHIAAIDNTTRKLVGEGKRPLRVGCWFSLGHSSVVFALAVLLNFGIRALDRQVSNGNSALHTATGIIGTGVSRHVPVPDRRAERDHPDRPGEGLQGHAHRPVRRRRARGPAGQARADEPLLRPLARRVDKPWKIYPIGVLFGLGFDTATEIALLVLAGTAVASGLPFYAILSMPLLFAGGMCLLDTIDGCFMNFAYDWAFARPVRKVYYNLTITGLSVFVAFFVGTVEVLGLIGQETGASGGSGRSSPRFRPDNAGFVIVGVFVLTWIVALAVWRFGRIEQKWDLAAHQGAD